VACCKCCCEAGASPGVCCGGVCCREPDACCGGACCAYPNSCCGGSCCEAPNECLSSGDITRCCEPDTQLCDDYCCPVDRACCSGVCCPPDTVCCEDVNGEQICCPADECVEGVCGNYCLAMHTAITVSALGKTIWSTMPVLEYPDKPQAVFWREARNQACDVFASPPADGLAGYSLCFAVGDRYGLNCALAGGGFGVCPNNPTPPPGMEGACCAFVLIMYHCPSKGSCDAFFELATATIWFKGTNVTVIQPTPPDGCPDLTVSAGIVNIGAPPENPLP